MSNTTEPTPLEIIFAEILDSVRLLGYFVSPSEMSELTQELPSNPTVAQLTSKGAIPDYTSRAIPGFLFLCFLELLVSLGRGQNVYQYNDFLASLSQGIFMLTTQIWFKRLTLVGYCWIFSNWKLVDSSADQESWLVWLLVLLGVDCGFYWFHRTAHSYHLLWAGHSLHHSGEYFNLATALRAGASVGWFEWIVYLPLAFFISPELYLMHRALNELGQFWVHTQLVGRLGPLEYILNTPSSHRMHHQTGGECNYAGFLIVWDRMFGTYRPEVRQEDRYGLAKQYTTFDPLQANVEHFRRLAATSGSNWSRYLLGKRYQKAMIFTPMSLFEPLTPAQDTWTIPDQTGKRGKFQGKGIWGRHWIAFVYATTILMSSLVGVLVLGDHWHVLTFDERLASTSLILWSLSSMGRVLDGLTLFYFAYEGTRLAVIATVAGGFSPFVQTVTYFLVAFGVLCNGCLLFIGKASSGAT